MTREEIKKLKKINEAALKCKPEMSGLAIKVTLAVASLIGLSMGFGIIIKMAGL